MRKRKRRKPANDALGQGSQFGIIAIFVGAPFAELFRPTASPLPITVLPVPGVTGATGVPIFPGIIFPEIWFSI
jgi:hypothetical protein